MTWGPLPPYRGGLAEKIRRGTFIDITIVGGISVGGDIISTNWDGTRPLNLNSRDAGATTGFGLDASAGSIQTFLFFASQVDADTVLTDKIRLSTDGPITNPPIALGAGLDSGIYVPGTDKLGFIINDLEVFRVTATLLNLDIGTLDFIRLPVKTDTGDPSSPGTGDMYVNTQDNVVRVFADSAWRDLATW